LLPEYEKYKPIEIKANLIRTDKVRPKHPDWRQEYSDWDRMVRAQAMIQRAVDCLKGREFRSSLIREQILFEVKDLHEIKIGKPGAINQRSFKRLTYGELLTARYALFRHAQMESYPDDYKRIARGKVPRDKMFRKLRPVFDTTNRVICLVLST
jgi:hypothetical protein